MRVTKTLRFCAAHRLLDYNGPCGNLHGHNYRVDITLMLLDDMIRHDMVVDFTDVKKIVGKFLNEHWDHALMLNRQDPLVKILGQEKLKVVLFEGNPTAENMARFLMGHFAEAFDHLTCATVVRVRVWETEDSYATATTV